MRSGNAPSMIGQLPRAGVATLADCFGAWRAVAPSLLFGLRLWASVSLALFVAYRLELDSPYWAGTTAAIVCQPQLGAALRKGWFRMIGTAIGAAMSVVLVASFLQDRVLFFSGLAVWVAACAFVARLLRNFASYAAAPAGYTTAIIAAGLFSAGGSLDANAAFLLAVARAIEICIGIACAGIVIAGTDLGGARRRLTSQFATLSAGITAGLAHTLAIAGCETTDTLPVHRAFVSRVVALDPMIEETLGESAQIRYHSQMLQSAVGGLLTALSGWRTAANHVRGVPAGESRQEATTVLQCVPPQLRSASQPGVSERWIADPVALHNICRLTVRRLIALPAATPSLRLLADKAAEAFAGIADALNGLALLAGEPARPIPPRGRKHVRIPDWLPALADAGRAFVTVCAITLFWVVTAWPGGSEAITAAAIIVLLLGARAEQAYGAAKFFTVGAILDAVITAIIAFAVLPALGIASFAGLSLVLAVCLVPFGALQAHAWHGRQVELFTAMTVLFIPLLRPTNPMTYNPDAFYNGSLTIVCGFGFAALSFRLLPPLSPAFRTSRLLTLSLRDLRRLAIDPGEPDWHGHMHGRLIAMPEEATPGQRAQLSAALSAGSEIINLRHSARHLGLGSNLRAALAALASGQSAAAIDQLSRLDNELATGAAGQPETEAVLRARGSILLLSRILATHAAYFDHGVQT